jgi:hypothetical protein
MMREDLLNNTRNFHMYCKSTRIGLQQLEYRLDNQEDEEIVVAARRQVIADVRSKAAWKRLGFLVLRNPRYVLALLIYTLIVTRERRLLLLLADAVRRLGGVWWTLPRVWDR